MDLFVVFILFWCTQLGHSWRIKRSPQFRTGPNSKAAAPNSISSQYAPDYVALRFIRFTRRFDIPSSSNRMLSPLRSSAHTSSSSYMVPDISSWNRGVLTANDTSGACGSNHVTVEYEAISRRMGKSSEVTTTYIPVLHFHDPRECLRVLRPRARTAFKERLLQQQFLPDFTEHLRGATGPTRGSGDSNGAFDRAGAVGTTTAHIHAQSRSAVALTPPYSLHTLKRPRGVVSTRKLDILHLQQSLCAEGAATEQRPVSKNHYEGVVSSPGTSNELPFDAKHDVASFAVGPPSYISTAQRPPKNYNFARDWYAACPMEVQASNALKRPRERSEVKARLISMQGAWQASLDTASPSPNAGSALTNEPMTPMALQDPMRILSLLAPRSQSPVKLKLLQIQSLISGAQGFSAPQRASSAGSPVSDHRLLQVIVPPSSANSTSIKPSAGGNNNPESQVFSPAAQLLQAMNSNGRLPKEVAQKLKTMKKALVPVLMDAPYELVQKHVVNRGPSVLKQRLNAFQPLSAGSALVLLEPMTLIHLARPRAATDMKLALTTMYPSRHHSLSKDSSIGNANSNYGGSSTNNPASTYSYRYGRHDSEHKSGAYDNDQDNDSIRFKSRGNIKEIPPDVLEEFMVKKTPAIDAQRYLRETFNLNLGIRDILRAMHEAASSFPGGRNKRYSGKTSRDRINSQRRSEAGDGRARSVDVRAESTDGSSVIVSKLAERLGKTGSELVRHLIVNKGILATMNQGIPISIAEQVAMDMGFEVVRPSGQTDAQEDKEGGGVSVNSIDRWAEVSPEDAARRATWSTRSPVVTVMGHVDHGKTSLLDRIRRTSVAASEVGGITQGISAFSVPVKGAGVEDESPGAGTASRRITFIDTPGHAAFSTMRSRGVNMTDIVVLVIAADDGIMEQTRECIEALKAAGSPVVVAINKIDKEGVDAQKVLYDLMNYGLMPEDFGGDVQVAMISARTGEGIEDLLDKIAVQAEIMDLRAPSDCPAQGVVVESRVRKGVGPVATVLVQKGTLRVGDLVLAGGAYGKVKKLMLSGSSGGSRGRGGSGSEMEVSECGPSTPVHVIGLGDLPSAGDAFEVSTDLNAIKQVAAARKLLHQQAISQLSKAAVTSMASSFVSGTLDTRERFKVPLVVVADSSGALEALLRGIVAMKDEDDAGVCVPDVVSSSVGQVTSGDVAIAVTTAATIVAYRAPLPSGIENEAKQANIPVIANEVVYSVLDDIKELVRKKLNPMPPGIFIGRAEVLKLFKFKTTTIAGCRLLEGSITKEASIRVLRGKRNVVFTGRAASLRLVKEVVDEVVGGAGMEFGLSCDTDFSGFEEGDIIECFKPTAATVPTTTTTTTKVEDYNAMPIDHA